MIAVSAFSLRDNHLRGIEYCPVYDICQLGKLYLDDKMPSKRIDAMQIENGESVLVRSPPAFLVTGMDIRNWIFEFAFQQGV